MIKKRREPLTPDLTALIDVVFILLIFFMVSSVFKKDELALKLSLPSSEASKLEIKEKQITLELTNSKIAYMGSELNLKTLDIKLSKITNNKKAIIFRINKDVSYDRVVQVLNLLQKHRLNNLALVTNK